MNNQKNGIACLENTLQQYEIEYNMYGKLYPNNITELTILGVTFHDMSAWDVESFMELNSAIKECIEDGMTYKKLKKFIADYDMSMSDVAEEYVKESYRNSHASLTTLLENAIKGSSYAQDKFESVFTESVTHEFKTTESAFLYKGLYITPCILKSVIGYAWADVVNKNEYIEKYYGSIENFNHEIDLRIENKSKIRNRAKSKSDKEIELIATDCLADLFNNDNIERLIMIDSLRVDKVGA